ncbi:MAG TPA: DUF6152 family protein [Bryobacteraceae bacterium]|jgi:hypothetical protein
MQFRVSKFCVWAVLVFSVSATAHHAISVEFDPGQRLTFAGVVTKVEWSNPHVYFYANIKEQDGKSANWAFEAAGPNQLARQGWNRDSLKIGDRVVVVGFPARGGAHVASARSVVAADGRKMFAGSPFDGGPKP